MAKPPSEVIGWLLASTEPAIRRLVRRDLLNEATDDDGPRTGRSG